jgi:hypothetical protein
MMIQYLYVSTFHTKKSGNNNTITCTSGVSGYRLLFRQTFMDILTLQIQLTIYSHLPNARDTICILLLKQCHQIT